MVSESNRYFTWKIFHFIEIPIFARAMTLHNPSSFHRFVRIVSKEVLHRYQLNDFISEWLEVVLEHYHICGDSLTERDFEMLIRLEVEEEQITPFTQFFWYPGVSFNNPEKCRRQTDFARHVYNKNVWPESVTSTLLRWAKFIGVKWIDVCLLKVRFMI